MEEVFDKLGDRFFELKKMVNGGYFAYDPDGNRSFGASPKDALENLLNKVYGNFDPNLLPKTEKGE